MPLRTRWAWQRAETVHTCAASDWGRARQASHRTLQISAGVMSDTVDIVQQCCGLHPLLGKRQIIMVVRAQGAPVHRLQVQK